MDAAQRHAMEVVRSADRDRYLAVLYAPEEKRGHLFALYAFNAEIAAIRDRIRDPLAGEMRLQWWRDVLSSNGEAAAGNPLAEALLQTIEKNRLPVRSLLDYLDARVFDLYDDPMPGHTDLEGYCGETASAIIQLAAIILDAAKAPSMASLAGHAGCAQAITGLLRLLPLHRSRGQCYVPADLLAAAGTSRDAFLSDEGEGAGAAVAAMLALAYEHLAAFEAEAGAITESLRSAFLPVALVPAYLLKVARIDPLREIADISAPRRHWLLLRHAMRGWSSAG